MSSGDVHVETRERELVITREFDAPRALVWRVWTEAAHLAGWWGPVGFSTTTSRIDVRPGGQWRFVMHGPDGRDYENLITYLEVVEPERLVYRHGGEVEAEPVDFTVTATFAQAGEKTRVTMRMEFTSRETFDRVMREYGALEGAKQTMGRLAEHLRRLRKGDGDDGAFVITRVFRAPRERAWRAWTWKEELEKWFGPKGVTIPRCSLDLRPGGVFHYLMRGPDGDEHWGKWVFREIVEPERLVFVVSFADERGNTARAPFDERWPLEMLSTVTFDEHAGIGRGAVVTVRWEAHGASEEERRTFEAGHGSMREGWTGTLEQLESFLAGR